jgi:hypothetical protein
MKPSGKIKIKSTMKASGLPTTNQARCKLRHAANIGPDRIKEIDFNQGEET